MKYKVLFQVTSYFNTYVEAGNEEDAKSKAIEVFDNADFGEGFNVGGEIISVSEE